MFIFTILIAIIIGCVHSQTQVSLPELPYAYNALEPVLSEHLIRLHHDKHFQTYANKTNIALRAMFSDAKNSKLKDISQQPIEVILTQVRTLLDPYRYELGNNGGGYLNHKLFFSMLKPPTATAAENRPTGPLLEAIEKSFGSFDQFKELFTVTAVNYFGAGWVWLYIDARTKQLVLNFTANQDNPIMFDKNHAVLLGIDLWEHAYYPVYENRRMDYVKNFWRIVNWSYVSQLYTEAMNKRTDL
jgi:Fe-Mn family superoxide dismutase